MMKEKLKHFQSGSMALGAVLVLVLLIVTTVIVAAQPALPGTGRSPEAVPASITVTKEAETETVGPDDRVAYTVVFSNSSDSDVALNVITDVLPSPFVYSGLAQGADPKFDEPGDQDEPTIVWQGTYTVPATDTLTLRYWVKVPKGTQASDTPYTNTVTAAYDGGTVGPAEAGVTVVSPDVSVSKTAFPLEIEPEGMVTYTVVFENDGNADAVIDRITDTLPAGFAFQDMLAGSTITDSPAGTTGSITWSGPFTVEAGSAITLLYQAKAEAAVEHEATNEVVALVDGESTEPATATVTFGAYRLFLPLVPINPPLFTATKEATVTEVAQGDSVVYVVKFVNEGVRKGTLNEIRDTLPAGFTFLNMEANSDVKANPAGTSGTIGWTGPFVVEPGQALTLVYRVKVSDVVGTHVNTVTATRDAGAAPVEPATVSVKVKELFLLIEDFETGTDGWEPFLNYWRLYPEQWYTQAGTGVGGSTGLNHDLCRGVTDPRGCERGAHDALYMYQGAGAEQWKNYRLEASMILRKGEKNKQMGLWIRGTYNEPADPDIDGKYVTGYYVTFGPGEKRNVLLARLRDSGSTAEHFSDPELLVRADKSMVENQWYSFRIDVVDNNIKVWVDGEPLIDHNDSTWDAGTVGFFAYVVEDAAWDNIVVTPLD